MKRSAKSASLAERIRRMKKEENAKKSPAPTGETPRSIEETHIAPTGSTATSPLDITFKRRKSNEETSHESQHSEIICADEVIQPLDFRICNSFLAVGNHFPKNNPNFFFATPGFLSQENLNTSSNMQSDVSGSEEGMDLFPWPKGSTKKMMDAYKLHHHHSRDLWFQLYDMWTVGFGGNRYGVGFHNPDSYNAFIVGNHAPRGTPVPDFVRETHPFIQQLRDEAANLKKAVNSLPAESPINETVETISCRPSPNDDISKEIIEDQNTVTESSTIKERGEREDPEIVIQPLKEPKPTSQEYSQLEENRDLEGNQDPNLSNSSVILSQTNLSADTRLEVQLQGDLQCSEVQNLSQLETAITPERVPQKLEGSDLQKALCSIHFLRSVGTDVDALKVDVETLTKDCRDAMDDTDRLSGEVQELELSIKELQRSQSAAPTALDLHRDQMNLKIAAIHARLACLEGQKDTEKISHSKSPISSELSLGQVQGYQLCIDDLIERGVFPWSLLDDPTFMFKVGDAENLKAKRPSGSNPQRWVGW